jgi:hypothetical protein
MKRLAITMLLLSALFGACASYPDYRQQRLESLPQHYKQFDVVMGWEVTAADGATVVQGVVRNVRYFMMRDLEIWVAQLDSKGKVAARGMTFIMPSDLRLDQSADFTIKIPKTVAAGDRLRFTYKYRGSDGGNGVFGDGGTNWMQSFQTVVPAR